MENGDDGFGGDRRESFHQNEAISAVVDEGFLGEEDDDYDDLYNDVNVGEGFLHSLQRNNASEGFKADEKPEDRRMEEPVGVEAVRKSSSAAAGSIPGVVPGDGRVEKDPPLAMDGAPKVYPGSQYHIAEGVPKGPPQTGPVGGMRIEIAQAPSRTPADVGSQINNRMQSNPGGNDNYERLPSLPPGGNNINAGNVNVVGTGGGSSGGGGTILFVGELHWWTTDAELESELSKYGQVKEVKFFDEKASGKSKGYCQVEFYDAGAAAACKEGMNGHGFNGRACVVAFASPYTVRKMGEAQVNKNQSMIQSTTQQGGRRGPGPGDMSGNGRGNAISIGSNYQGGDQGRNYGRGNWGRGGGMANRGQMGPMRNRMGMGGRGMMGNNVSGFGQGIGAVTPPLLHPQTMMGQGFDPSYAAMGRMGGFGGFPGGPAPPFSGMMPSFPPVGGMGMPGVAPHVNPAFFGRGMPANGMGMMHVSGVEGSGMGMWSDPNMAGWGGEEQGGRAGESSYGEDATSEHQYGEGSRERGGWQNPAKDKDRTSERDLSSGGPERRYRDDREPGWERGEKEADPPSHGWTNRRHDDREMEWDRGRDHESDRERERDRDRGRERDRGRDDRDRYREERDRLSDHLRHKDRDLDHDDDWDRRRSSRNRSKSRMSQEEEQHNRSREVEHGKRRRLPSE